MRQGFCRDSAPVNVLSAYTGWGEGAETGAALAGLFCYFIKNIVVTHELEIVLGDLICQFVMDENQNKKNMVVYDQIH